MRTVVLLALLCTLVLGYSRNWCPAHRTTTVTLEDGSTRSVVEPCPETPLLKEKPKTESLLNKVGDNHDPFDVLPKWIGNVKAGQPMSWSGRCFTKNTISITTDDKGFTLSVDLASPVDLTCVELGLWPTTDHFLFHMFVMRGHHEIRSQAWADDDERADVEKNGVAMFIFPEKILQTLMDAYDLYKIFAKISDASAAELVKFSKEYFNYDFKPRTLGLLDIPDSAIHNGDVFALHVMTPHETIDWMLTGSHSGHVAVAFVVDGSPYVFETTDAKFIEPGPMYGFHMTPFQKWKKIYADQGYEISWMPIRRDISARLDVNKAYKWFLDHRMPFDTPSFGFTALDTPNDNFPPPFTADNFFTLLHIFDHFENDFVQYQLTEGLNMRFQKYYASKTNCSDIACALQKAFQLNTTLPEVMALPERDGWLYKTGESIVCANVVTSMLKQSGAFGNLDITTGEFDPKDVYQLNIYETEWADRPAACKGSTQLPNEVPYCQIAGKWAMELPEYNTVTPYSGMNLHCGALPPTYHRFPNGC